MQSFFKKSAEKLDAENREALERHNKREEFFRLENEKKSKKKKSVLFVLGGVLLLLVVWAAYYFTSPGEYDAFAKCLTEKGVVMYGENWCQYTNAQKNMFGKSFKYINYQVKTDLRKRPTWLINNKTYETVQSFERLAMLADCKIK